MMKHIFVYSAIVVLGVAAAGWYVYQTPHAIAPEMIHASYTDGSATVEAAFDTHADTVTFSHPALGRLTLPRAMSGSGARYADPDEHVVFWEHQGELTITEGEVTVFQGMVVAQGSLADFSGRTWVWTKTVMTNGALTVPRKEDAFTLTVSADGEVSGTTDCNSFFGTLEVGPGHTVRFGPLGGTKKYCEGAQEAALTSALVDSRSYTVDPAGNIVLIIGDQEGSIYFKAR